MLHGLVKRLLAALVMAHMHMSHGIHAKEPCHATCASWRCNTAPCSLSRVPHTDESWHVCIWVMAHMPMSRVTELMLCGRVHSPLQPDPNGDTHAQTQSTGECDLCHKWVWFVSQVSVICVASECDLCHKWVSHVTCQRGICTYECVMSVCTCVYVCGLCMCVCGVYVWGVCWCMVCMWVCDVWVCTWCVRVWVARGWVGGVYMCV